MSNPQSAIRNPQSRPGFTLMELLVVIMIIALLASLAMMALAGAAESARADRTRSIINKIDQLIREKYESYRTRAVPLRIPPTLSTISGGATYSARVRLYALRELMRLELPDRITDLCNAAELTDVTSDSVLGAIANYNDARRTTLFIGTPNVIIPMPAAAKAYKRQANRNLTSGISSGWSTANQGAECLYLILSATKDGEKSALDFFSASEIGDTDEDGFKEILDAWGEPIVFLRWAPGYVPNGGSDGAWGVSGTDDDNNNVQDDISEAGLGDDVVPNTLQTSNYLLAPDPFDPIKCDPRYANQNATQKPYALWPLIFSTGRDRVADISVGTDLAGTGPLIYANTAVPTAAGNDIRTWTTPPNDPYFSSAVLVGTPQDTDGDGSIDGYADNITNHYQAAP
jgi:prepilin-type N-terminal cleavage/methylation domain-containing protein